MALTKIKNTSLDDADLVTLGENGIGTSANQIVQLDFTGKLPAVDGSQLTNLAGGGSGDLLSTNNLSDLANVTTSRSNLGLVIGTSANQIVKLDGSAKLPAVDGSQLTNLAGGGATDINGLSDGVSYVSGSSFGLGSNALANNGSGTRNIAIGFDASRYAVGYFNTCVGYNAGKGASSTTTGNSNCAFGMNTLEGVTSGASNVAIGKSTMYQSSTASNNSGMGNSALQNLSTGSNNMGLGNDSGGFASPSGMITSGSNAICLGNNSITALYCADTTISSSDKRDKADIEDFNTGLGFINKMRPVTYRWDKRSWYLDDGDNDVLGVTRDGSLKKQKQHLGFIAQEVEELEQEIGFSTSKDNQLICNINEDETAMGIKYERIVPILVNAIKELSANNTALLARIETLEN
jgi:hypothetical protein